VHVHQLPDVSLLHHHCAPARLHRTRVAVLELVAIVRQAVNDAGAVVDEAGQLVGDRPRFELPDDRLRSVEQAGIVVLQGLQTDQLLVVHGDHRERGMEFSRH
jgi:hypothetical protein